MKKNFGKIFLLLAILAGYVWICLRLFFTGKISYYVHPDFVPLTLITGLVLLLILMFLIISLGLTDSGGKLSTGLWEHKFRMLLVLLPIVLFVAFQPKALSSQAFATRSLGQTTDLGLSRSIDTPVQFVLNTENRELIDWIRLFAQNAEPEVYQGMKAKVTGFILIDESLPPNHFTIARFVISCCAADARPIGLIVKYDAGQFQPTNDQWLELRGEFIIEEINGERKPILYLKEAKPIEIPANPYIS
jgi:uncharacterized repeat protein (TIGR03943 family)